MLSRLFSVGTGSGVSYFRGSHTRTGGYPLFPICVGSLCIFLLLLKACSSFSMFSMGAALLVGAFPLTVVGFLFSVHSIGSIFCFEPLAIFTCSSGAEEALSGFQPPWFLFMAVHWVPFVGLLFPLFSPSSCFPPYLWWTYSSQCVEFADLRCLNASCDPPACFIQDYVHFVTVAGARPDRA